jgi:2'-5' RNA ligase
VIRLFAALAAPAALAERLAALAKGLPGNVQPPENLHLTLAFFGEIDEAQAEDLHGALEAVEGRGFDWWLDGVGAFGGDRPRAIYAAVRPEPALDLLQAKVAQAARGAGVAVEARRYVPHVTLSRIRPGAVSPAEAAKALAARAAFLAGPVAARAFHLYRSDLGRHGPAYEILADYPLTPPDA